MLAVLALSSCAAVKKPIVAGQGPAGLKRESSATELREAEASLRASVEAIKSKVAASLEVIKDATEKPATAASEVANRESSVALLLLNTAPSETDLSEAHRRADSIFRGSGEDVAREYSKAQKESSVEASKIVDLEAKFQAAQTADQKAREDARLERERSARNLQEAIDKIKSDNEIALQQAKNEEAHRQANIFNIAGGVSMIAFMLAVGFGGLAGARAFWPFVVGALICFGMAQLVSQWWYKWAVLGTLGLGAGGTIWWLFKIHFSKVASEVKASQYKEVLNEVVPALDNVIENADEKTKQFIEAHTTVPMRKLMSKSAKAVVHTIRSELKR